VGGSDVRRARAAAAGGTAVGREPPPAVLEGELAAAAGMAAPSGVELEPCGAGLTLLGGSMPGAAGNQA